MLYSKLDWCTVMFENVSLKDVCKKLHIDVDCYDEILSSAYERSLGYDSRFVFKLHGISFDYRFDDVLKFVGNGYDPYLEDQFSIDFFDAIVSSIRVDISGTGLDYLRNLFDVDACLIDINYFAPLHYHVTRADFAFDFVNEKYDDYFIKLYDLLLYYIRNSRRGVSVVDSGVPLKFDLHHGQQRTMYIGSSRSDRYLRIYDKKMQCCPDGIWNTPAPITFTEHEEKDIDTWFRIEFQCRNDRARELLYGCSGDLKNVLLLMIKHYRFTDLDRCPLLWVDDLYDWVELTPIIQNAKYVETKKTLDRSKHYLKTTAFCQAYVYCALYGPQAYIDLLNQEYKETFNPSKAGCYRQRRLFHMIASVIEESENNISLKDFRGLDRPSLDKDTVLVYDS